MGYWQRHFLGRLQLICFVVSLSDALDAGREIARFVAGGKERRSAWDMSQMRYSWPGGSPEQLLVLSSSSA